MTNSTGHCKSYQKTSTNVSKNLCQCSYGFGGSICGGSHSYKQISMTKGECKQLLMETDRYSKATKSTVAMVLM